MRWQEVSVADGGGGAVDRLPGRHDRAGGVRQRDVHGSGTIALNVGAAGVAIVRCRRTVVVQIVAVEVV